MFFAVVVFLAGIFSSINGGSTASIPSYIHVCKRSDPKVEQCVINSVEDIRPTLKKGIPELDVPAIEPLLIPEVGVPGRDGGSAVAYGRNIKVHGASDFKVDSLKVDFSNPSRLVVHLGLTLPHLELEGEYEINTKVLVVPVKGKGPISFNATNTKADVVLNGQIYKKGSNNYLRFFKVDMSLKMEDYVVHLGNLFNGDKVLGEATNQVLNENKNDFKEALSPIVTKTVSEFVLEVANKITKTHPYDALFPK